jgi:hypothetical protein
MNLTPNSTKVYNSTAITDEILAMSHLPKQGDEKKILSGMSQSWRGVDLN